MPTTSCCVLRKYCCVHRTVLSASDTVVSNFVCLGKCRVHRKVFCAYGSVMCIWQCSVPMAVLCAYDIIVCIRICCVHLAVLCA